MRQAMTWLTLLCLALACRPNRSAVSNQNAAVPAGRVPLAALPPSSRIILLGDGFRLPAGCTLNCVLAVDAFDGDIHCFDVAGSIHYSGAFGAVIARSLEPTEARAADQRKLESVLMYWGQGGQGNREYCAIVTHPTETSGDVINHQFCTTSDDGRLRARVREIAESYERAPSKVENTACRFEG